MNYLSGQGALYAAERDRFGAPGAYRFLGNCSGFVVNLGAGGMRFTGDGALRRNGALPSVAIDFESFSKDNMVMLLHGAPRDFAGGVVTDQIVVRLGGMVPLSRINLTSFTALKTASGATVYSRSQYRVDLAAGVIHFPANSTVPANAVLLAEYVAAPSYSIGAYTKEPPFVQLRFNGINTLDRTPLVAEVFKVKLDPVDAIGLINDNLSSLKLVGRVYRDDGANAIPDDGLFMKIVKT